LRGEDGEKKQELGSRRKDRFCAFNRALVGSKRALACSGIKEDMSMDGRAKVPIREDLEIGQMEWLPGTEMATFLTAPVYRVST
jgi:hypothetical protein